MLDLPKSCLEEVQSILNRHLPGCEVRAFGSRVNSTARPFSDLDLAIMTSSPLDINTLIALRDSFSDSNLPFTVDIVDWSKTGESFRKIIDKDYVVIQEGLKG